MPYLGNELATQFQAFVTQTITGDGSTGYTLDRAVANGKELLVYINNVKQEEGSGKSYTASGTTITFSAAVASTDSCYVVFLGSAVQTVAPPDASVGTSTLRNASLELPSTLDMNGNELILDADADTSITADTDDQIDIKIAGSDSLRIKASEIENVSGSFTLDVDNFIIFDADGGRTRFADDGTIVGSIQSDNSDFNFVSEVSDKDIVFSGNDGGSGIEAMRIDMSQGGHLVIGDTDSNGFGLKVKNQLSTFETTGNDTFGQVFLHATGTNNDAQLVFSSDSNGRGIYVDESDSNTFRIYSGAGKGHSSDFKIDNSGNVTIGGSLSKGSGSFKIRHPLESKKDTHWLVHSFVEGPQADNLYRGRVTLKNGVANVNVDTASGMTDGTFVLLNRDIQCFTTNETGWTAIKGSVSGNILTITAQDNTCTDTISWMVIGERQDDHMKQDTTGWTDSDGKIIIEPELTKTEKEDKTDIVENPVLKFDYSELEKK